MKLEIPSGPKALDQLQSVLESFWRQHEHVPQQIRTEVAIAAGEIAANILEHARAMSLWIDLRARPGAVELEFIDCGDPADIDLDATTMPDEMAEGGRGLALAQAALNLLTYFRDEVGNHWKLVSKAFSSNSVPEITNTDARTAQNNDA